MKQLFVFCMIVGLGLCFIAAPVDRVQDVNLYPLTVKETPDNPATKMVKRDPDFGKIPLYFIPNQGQVDEKARFYAKTSRYMLWMTKQGLVFDSIRKVEATHPAPSGHPSQEKHTPPFGHPSQEGNKGLPHSPYSPDSPKIERDVSRLIFLDANSNPELVPIELAQHKVNYFKGKEPSMWQTGIQTSKAVLYKDIYKSIDLKVYGVEKQVEYDWIVKAGADPGKISFEYKNVKSATIDDEGNLVIETIFGKLMHKKPVSYQLIKGKRVPVKSTFKKTGKNTYGFKVERYNRNYELIIDPMVCPIYSTYLGGSGYDYGFGIAVDRDGYAYVTGYTYSTDFPTENAYQETLGGNLDVFVTKLSPADGCPVYSTYLGGSKSDAGRDIAVDSNRNAYVTGETYSTDFSIHNACQNSSAGGSDAFVARFCFCDSQPVLVVNKTLLNFAKNNWGDTTDSQSFLIRNIGEGTLNWAVSDDADWLTCSPASGTNFGEVTVTVDASGLEPCTYTGAITISDANAINSPQRIPVTLRVYGPKGPHPLTARPFGFFETPGEGATVRGSVPFTGWALTHPPKTIPPDGIDVYIDGVNLGKVNYGLPRTEVCGLFPGYNNCPGPGFYFDLNTTDLDNGMHTIQCVVTDGIETDGIGSRYFYAWNLGTISSLSQTADRKYHLMSEIADIPLGGIRIPFKSSTDSGAIVHLFRNTNEK